MSHGVAALALVAAAAAAAHAQTMSLEPSLHVSEVYDDNLFNTPAGEADTITRVGSRLDARFGSERQTFSARYAIDADRFAKHTELTTVHARQDAGFDERYLATRRLSFAATAAFAETQTPAELNADSGLAPGVARARRISAGPSATYQVTPLTSATVGYSASNDRMLGVDLTTQTATALVDLHRSAREAVRWEYGLQSYTFNATDRKTSQVVAVEWTRDLTRATGVSLRGGPRLTDGALSADVAVSMHHASRAGDLSLAYTHTQTTLIGLVGVADTHSLTARVGVAARSGLEFRVEPAVLRTAQIDLASTVYRVSIGCVRPIAPALAIEASYDLNMQHGNIYTAQQIETIGRNVIVIKLVAAAGRTARRRSA